MPASRSKISDRVVSEKLNAIRRMMRAYFVVLRTFGKTDAATPDELLRIPRPGRIRNAFLQGRRRPGRLVPAKERARL